MMCTSVPCTAMASEKVAEFAASGIVFKDKVDVVSLPDEKVCATTEHALSRRTTLRDHGTCCNDVMSSLFGMSNGSAFAHIICC